MKIHIKQHKCLGEEMKVNVDAKLLLDYANYIVDYTAELQSNNFKIVRSQWGDLIVVKFQKVHVEISVPQIIFDAGKEKNKVQVRAETAKKDVIYDVVITDKKIHFVGAEYQVIDLRAIDSLDLYANSLVINCNNQRLVLKTHSFKLNIYIIAIIEFILSTTIDDSLIGKNIKFAKNVQ